MIDHPGFDQGRGDLPEACATRQHHGRLLGGRAGRDQIRIELAPGGDQDRAGQRDPHRQQSQELQRTRAHRLRSVSVPAPE
jgi:hypothetical protein